MKHTLKDLDQFFDAAKNEAPILGEKDFAALLDRADAVAPGSTEIMRQSPTSQFGSWVRMAINQHGGMIMTGFGLTAITGLLITGAYLSSPDEPKQPMRSANVVAGSVEQNKQTEAHSAKAGDGIRSEVTNDNGSEISSEKTSKSTPFRSDSSLWVNVKIEGVKPLEVTPKEIAALGITEERDGRVYLLHQTKNKGLTIRTAFPMEPQQPYAQHFAQHNAAISNGQVEGNVASVMPAMVTDAKGKKLAFFFTSDSSGLNFSASFFSSVQREENGNGFPPKIPIPRVRMQTPQGERAFEFAINGIIADEEETADKNEAKRSVIKQRQMMKLKHDSLSPRMQAGMTFQLSDKTSEFPHEAFQQAFDSANFPLNFGQNFQFQELEDMDLSEFDFGQDSNSTFDFDFEFDHELNVDAELNIDHELDIDIELNVDSLTQQSNDLQEQSENLRKKVMTIRINGDSIRREVLDQVREQAMTIRVNADSLRRQALKQSKAVREQAMKIRINSDSLRRQVLEQSKMAREQALKIRITSDSLRQNVMEQLKHLKHMDHLKHMEHMDYDSLPQINGLRMMIINHDSSAALDWSKLPKPVIVADFRKQREMIDKLVPVQIVAKNEALKYNKNGLIFWYIPDEKFREVAPESAREISMMTEVKSNDRPAEKMAVASKAGVIADPLVYPNPSQGRSTFKYTLDEPRAVSIAVHDLLGKQVMVVSNAELKSAGTFEKELDFSSLDAGVYLLVMVTDKGEQITQRVVIGR